MPELSRTFPLPRAELATLARDIRRQRARMGYAVIGGSVVVICLLGGMRWLSNIVAPGGQLKTLAEYAATFGALAGIAIVFICIIAIASRLCRDLRCPLCQRLLDGPRDLDLAVTLGGCPHCDGPLAVEAITLPGPKRPDDVPPSGGSTNCLESRLRESMRVPQSPRDSLVPLAFAGAGTAVLLTSLAIGLPWFNRLLEREMPRRAMGVAFLSATPGVVTAFWGLLVVARKKRRQEAEVRCPGCEAPLGGKQIVLKTGHCHRCGVCLFPTDSLSRPQDRVDRSLSLPMEDLRAKARSIDRNRIWPCLVGGMSAASWLALWALLFDWWNPWDVSHENPLSIMFMVLAVPVQFAGVVGASRRLEAGLICPACHRRLGVHRLDLLLTTRRCAECGIQVVSEPVAETA